MPDVIVGIDLGTTNSEVAIVEDGQPRVLVEDGDPILPSIVGLAEDGRLLVGKAARNQWVLAPERTVKSIKRKMGQDVKVALGDQQFTPQEISAMILRTLKARAERELGVPVVKAVITVPAYFNDSQRQATREAGELAGLDVVRILNEPTAAALTYNPDQSKAERILVYDLGGGTFDVSIVHTENGVVEVLASHGDTALGGDDFDELLLDSVADEFKEMYEIDLRASRTSRARLLRAVEDVKKRLSDHPFTRIEEEFVAEKDGVPLHLSTEVERADYEELIRPLLDRTMECVQRALDDAHLTGAQIDRVVLVGGSTRTPLVGQLLEDRLGQPAHREVNPDLCVALGAAVQGAIVAGQNVGSVLVDITPHSIGIKCLELADPMGFRANEYKFAAIVRRNTPLPASRSEVFCTVSDSQPTVEIDVYQGENADVRRNHRVGRFMIEGLAKVPAGNQLVVQLDLTLDGVLKVSAREKSTGLTKQITVENALARYAVTERASAQARLDRMWADLESLAAAPPGPDDELDEAPPGDPAAAGLAAVPAVPTLDPGPREGQRETVQARALLEKADRIRAKAPAEDQEELDRLTGRVRDALTDRRWNELAEACNDLSDVLFYLEDA
ncbi:MAG TPA: Hsp70 family protein [Urbifossiella sp.]|jgi:molecular chaperone DnaK|nr:Hsp70 family protein [Urbifossiella sp.]